MPLGNMDTMTDDQTKALSTGFANWQAQHNPQPSATTTPTDNPAVPDPNANVAYNTTTTGTSLPGIGAASRAAEASNGTQMSDNSTFAPRSVVPLSSAPFTGIIPGYSPSATNTQPTQAPQQDGTLHLSVNGQTEPDVPVFKGTSFESGADLAKQLGLDYKADPKTGEITIGGTKVMPTGYDKQGNAIVGVRAVANALGYQIGYDDKSKQITITGKSSGPGSAGDGTQGWQAPDMSSAGSQMMPYGTFNGDMNSYYTQAHNQLDNQYNQQKQALIDKQNLDITKSDESMNRRGIYSSGVAQSVEDDLRNHTTAAIANVLGAQMANVAKTAQSLYDTAYKQYMDGNNFALKNNQAVITNMLNAEKQSFNEYIQTHKLSDAEMNAANAEFDKQAALIQKQTQAELPYKYQTANNAADNQTKSDIALLPYQQMTVYQQMTTQEKAAMDQATNYFKQQGIAVDYAKLAESIRHNTTTETETKDHNAATEANAIQVTAQNKVKETNANLYNIWKATGKAPAGIDQVPEGTPFVSDSTTKIDPKDSYSQAASFKSQLNAKLTNDSKNIDHSKAAAFIDANKGVLTDSDYRDLQAWVDTTFKSR